MAPAFRSIIPGTTALAKAEPERKFICMTVASTSGNVSTNLDRLDTPPLLIKTSTLHSLIALCPNSVTDSGILKSQVMV
jgi:hypothetical protein